MIARCPTRSESETSKLTLACRLLSFFVACGDQQNNVTNSMPVTLFCCYCSERRPRTHVHAVKIGHLLPRSQRQLLPWQWTPTCCCHYLATRPKAFSLDLDISSTVTYSYFAFFRCLSIRTLLVSRLERCWLLFRPTLHFDPRQRCLCDWQGWLLVYCMDRSMDTCQTYLLFRVVLFLQVDL